MMFLQSDNHFLWSTLKLLGCPNRSCCFVTVYYALMFLFGQECDSFCSISVESGIKVQFHHTVWLTCAPNVQNRNLSSSLLPLHSTTISKISYHQTEMLSLCLCISLHKYESVNLCLSSRRPAVITSVDYSTWPDWFGLGTTGWGYVSPFCPSKATNTDNTICK